MTLGRRPIAVLSLIALAAALFGCARSDKVMGRLGPAPAPATETPAPPSGTQTLTVLAAASLSKPFDALGAEFGKQHPGVKYQGSYAGTQELLAQMQGGAQADVFAAASQEYMSEAIVKKLVQEPHTFATNRLCAVVSPKASGIATLKDLAKPGVKLVVAVDKAPIGKYTRKVFDKLAADKDLGAQVVTGLKANIHSEETDVKFVLTRVQLGEADAGFVYESDAASAGDQVRKISIPDADNVVASYPLAVCSTAPNGDLAAQFVALVASPEGQAILRQYGFGEPPPADAKPKNKG